MKHRKDKHLRWKDKHLQLYVYIDIFNRWKEIHNTYMYDEEMIFLYFFDMIEL